MLEVFLASDKQPFIRRVVDLYAVAYLTVMSVFDYMLSEIFIQILDDCTYSLLIPILELGTLKEGAIVTTT